jgi:hypothetical protein
MEAETPERDEQRMALEKTCANIGHMLADIMPPGTGFVFAMFDFGDDGNMAYLSNAEREGMMKMLTELVTKLQTATQ